MRSLLLAIFAFVAYSTVWAGQVADREQAVKWLFSQPYFRDIASSFPPQGELITEGAIEDPKLPGFYLCEVRAFISEKAAGTHFIGNFRFCPSENILKKQRPITCDQDGTPIEGEFVDAYKLAKEEQEAAEEINSAYCPTPDNQVVAVVLHEPAPTPRPKSTPRPTPTPRPEPEKKKQPVIVSVVQHGSYADVYDERGIRMFSCRSDGVAGFTPSTVSVRIKNYVYTYDTRGIKMFSRPGR